MKRLATILISALVLGLALAPSSQAEYGISSFDVQIAEKAPAVGDEADLAASGGAYHQAGGHPYSVVTHFEWNNHQAENGLYLPDGDIKNTEVTLPAGLVGNPSMLPTCTAEQLVGNMPTLGITGFVTECPVDSQVGVIRLRYSGALAIDAIVPLFNMQSPTGLAGRFGFNAGGTLVFFDASTGPDRDYRITVGSYSTQQAIRVYQADVAFWGVPADSIHDQERCSAGAVVLAGTASRAICPGAPGEPLGPHSAGMKPVAFLTMPTSCGPASQGEEWPLQTNSWQQPGIFRTASAFSHLPPFAPSAPGPQQGTTGCNKVPFNPDFSVQPSQKSAASSSGLEVELGFPTGGLMNPDGIAQSHLKKAVVTLPEGMTVNPSQAEGLGVCTPEQYEAASVKSFGCPSTSKIGTVSIKTPLLQETVEGNVYIAEPFQNPFDSLLALYIVARNHERGIVITLPGKVEPDPRTGQITTTFSDLPQQPVDKFTFKFREGPRAPLITPRTCGTYTTTAALTPWSDPSKTITTESSFEIDRGVDGSACPSEGVPPFNPGFSAGSLNNNAGAYSEFAMRLTRSDGEQDMTKFSALLPPGVSAKIAGVGKCGDDAIAVAAEKTGTEEIESPSCPANSKIGSILAGAGVGSTLVYVPGELYLAGPYQGAPLSVVAITPAVAGPFDVGTVIVREALTLDPRTAVVRVDGDRSDPIPHILAGIPLAIRDIRVKVDRPSFTINPTSCDPSAVGATLFGSYLDLFSASDDLPVALSSRFQASNCAALGFKPRLSIKLTGGTKRGDFPGLRGELRPRPGDANLDKAVVTLPRSAFLEQGHIGTICTRVQFAADACPPKSIYGHVRAFTPLLDEPLEGPVYLRSSNNKLPDLVMALKGIVEIEAAGRIDSVRLRGGGFGIRATFAEIPDAPLTKVLLRMQGAKKGLIINSRNLCKGKAQKAKVQLDGQNAKHHDFRPKVGNSCRRQAKRPNRNKR